MGHLPERDVLVMFFGLASAATLPGVSVPFDVDAEGRWVLSAELPPPLVTAGAKPGWVLVAVDDVPVAKGPAAQRQVAEGPARNVQLRFLDPTVQPPKKGQPALPSETVLVVRRSELVAVESLAVLPWPDGFQGPRGAWHEDWAGIPVLPDAAGKGWSIDPDAGAFGTASPLDDADPFVLPEVFWELSTANWAIVRPDGVTTGNVAWARGQFADAARLRTWKTRSGDHLLVAGPNGVEVLSVDWPRGTPVLPVCSARVPETCLASGRQLLAELGSRAGARPEALRQLGVACANGVHRGCYEAVALEDASLGDEVEACIGGADVAACNTVAGGRFDLAPEAPDDLVIGLLDYACELEGAGSLGERLRRLEDVGVGCVRLASAYDALKMPDQALLNLDQACVLGRADACEQATERRALAFAARTVRECEDPELPVPSSCVELGRLLQVRPVPASTVDEFGAFLRGCNLGDADGCLALGDYVDRWGIDHPRVSQAEAELRQSCSAGEQRACLGAAHLLVRHDPRSDAYGEALTLFSGACNAGLGPACVAGAQQRRIGAARKVEAPDQSGMWNQACALHTSDGCAGLGQRMIRRKLDWPAAFGAWTQACDLGDPHSCSELGQLVERDHEPLWEGEQAPQSYLSRGCDNGDPEGCFWLAEDTLPKSGEPPEPTYVLLDRSCEGEYGPGCAELADVHLERRTSFDDEIAARHLDTACNNGFYESCKVLGTMYLRGKGVERDRQKANELLDRFRLNATRKYVRLGVQLGIASVAGGELELVVPIPVGPAISISGNGSYIPGLGTFMVLLEGDTKPEVQPDLQVLGASVRLYANHQARGMFAAVGVHQLTALDDNAEDRVRSGWSARVGIRNDSKVLFSGLEIGFGQYGVVDISDFDDDEKGIIPLILPTVAFTFGLAPF